jgi:hypothetical protein
MAAKKSASRKTSAKKKPAKKVTAKSKAPARKVAAKKVTAKKAAPKKAVAKKAAAKKAPAKKAAPKKAAPKKAPPKKAAPKKAPPKKVTAKQAPGPTAAQRALYTTALAGKTINDLKTMLRANDQLTGGTRGELVERVVDRVVNGNLPRCPQCYVGRLRVNAKGKFSCPGGYDDDEYQECSFTGVAGSIERPAWQVQTPGGAV